MKLLALLLLALPNLAKAQVGHGDRFTTPCGFVPNDSIDLTADGIADVVIKGYRKGTEDVPSSSGSCTLTVQPLPGTVLLCERSTPHGPAAFTLPYALSAGDTLRRISPGPENDQHGQRTVFMQADIPVMQWGYGAQERRALLMKGTSTQVFGFQAITEQGIVVGTFRLKPLPDLRYVHITEVHTSTSAAGLIVR